MHTSVHELCMHNIIHTLYCAYLSVLLVQCTLYTTYSMHTRVLRARVHTTSQYSRVWYAYNHSSSNTHVLFILCILASSTRSQRTLYTYYERTLDMHRSATSATSQQSMHTTREYQSSMHTTSRRGGVNSRSTTQLLSHIILRVV